MRGERANSKSGPLIRPLAWAKLKLRFGVAWSGTFSLWEKGKNKNRPSSDPFPGRFQLAQQPGQPVGLAIAEPRTHMRLDGG